MSLKVSRSNLIARIKRLEEGRNLNVPTSKLISRLEDETAIYIPSTEGIKNQKIISNTAFKRRVRNVRRYLSVFGGYTSVKTMGGYVLKGGKVVRERGVKVTAFADRNVFKKNKTKLINKASEWRKKWKQDSVGLEYEGDLYFIGSPRKKKLNPQRLKVSSRNLKKARSVRMRNLRRR